MDTSLYEIDRENSQYVSSTLTRHDARMYQQMAEALDDELLETGANNGNSAVFLQDKARACVNSAPPTNLDIPPERLVPATHVSPHAWDFSSKFPIGGVPLSLGKANPRGLLRESEFQTWLLRHLNALGALGWFMHGTLLGKKYSGMNI